MAGTECILAIALTLDVTRAGDRQVVHLGAIPVARYHVTDVTSRRHAIVKLAEAGTLAAIDIAEVFDVTPVHVSELRGRYRQQGQAGIQQGRRGPHGPMKVRLLIERRILELGEKGLSNRAMAQRLMDSEKEISRDTVGRILLKRQPQQAILPSIEEPEPDAQPAVPLPTEVESIGAVAQGPSRYAVVMLLHLALGQLGLWSVFESLGAQLDRSRMAAAQLIVIVALGFALRFKSIERFKTAARRDFGMLLGLSRVPSVQTLRTHVQDLDDSVDSDAVMRKLLAPFVELEPVWEGAY